MREILRYKMKKNMGGAWGVNTVCLKLRKVSLTDEDPKREEQMARQWVIHGSFIYLHHMQPSYN